jgi:WD40 repeat protein
VAFSPNGKLLASTGPGGTVQLWKPGHWTARRRAHPVDTGPNGRVSAVAFSPNGKLLATADPIAPVQLWQISLFAHPYATLCTDVGPPTRQDWAKYAAGEPQPKICA